MNDSNILVSIIVITYGHEKYISQALDSILTQKVNFIYEVIIGEDYSPDNTRNILQEYERKHPDKFIMVYRNENIGGRKNRLDLISRSKGKYLAYLEGDDYWICEDKLQKQVDFLESHDDFIATAHRVKIVDKDDKKITTAKYPECKENLYNLKHYQKGILPGQTASIVKRNVYKDKSYDISIMTNSTLMPGDRIMTFLLVSHGKIYCFPDIMSAYRYVTDSGTSFSAKKRNEIINNPFKQIEYYKAIMQHSHKHIANKKAIETIESLYLFQVVYAFLRSHKTVKWANVREAYAEIRNRSEAIRFVLFKLTTLPLMKVFFKINGIIGR